MSDYIYGSSLRAAKSKANYLFEGDFRRRPNQNLSGASRSVARVDLLRQAAEQRQTREDTRHRENASVKIQSVWRAHRCRRMMATAMRARFDSATKDLSLRDGLPDKPKLSQAQFEQISRELLLFYHSKQDEQRFVRFIDLMTHSWQSVSDSKAGNVRLWLFRVAKLLRINMDHLERNLAAERHLKFLEYYTRPGDILDNTDGAYVWPILIKHKFYSVMRKLAETSDSDLQAPSELDKFVVELLRRSLDIALSDRNGRLSGLPPRPLPAYTFFEQFLHGPLRPLLESHYFPELLRMEPCQLRPKCILEAFAQSEVKSRVANNLNACQSSSPSYGYNLEEGKQLIWLCYLFVRALYTRVGTFDQADKVEYINIIASLSAPAELITNISALKAANEDTDDQGVDDDELSGGGGGGASGGANDGMNLSSRAAHQMAHQKHHSETHKLIKKLVELINQLQHINSLKPIIFSDQYQAQVQGAIVQICSLMLSHEYLAIFNCRLLYTVAFSKEFSRSLWKSILASSTASLYGNNVPLYQLISRGSQSIQHDSWKTILPRLRLFCSLCSYLLPTLGDDEFYTNETNSLYSEDNDVKSRRASLSRAKVDDDTDTRTTNATSTTTNTTTTTTTTATTITTSTATATSTTTKQSETQPGSGNKKASEPPGARDQSASSGTIASFYVDRELVGISAILRDMCVGLVEIIYQGNCQATTSSHRTSPGALSFGVTMGGGGARPGSAEAQNDRAKLLSFEIKSTFQALVRLVCQLHARDSRKQFCPDGHWICPSVIIPANKAVDFQMVTSQQGRLLNQITRDQQASERLDKVSSEIKTVLILQEIPFVISFYDRVQIFHQLLRKERQIHQSEGYNFGLPGTAISVQIRRNYLYEDAFERLSFDNEPNMKLPMKVSLVNAVGAHEAGIDGGGLTKEFLDELLKAGFDPMRGFFKYTKDHFLYPNPSANVLFSSLSEGFEVHYEFLGRMLGKAIFEKIMVELPLASFFLAKLLAVKHSSDVDLHNLESLDPVLYKNLVYLKNYKGDVADLNLDFTISNNELDEHEVLELKPGGSRVPVTRENKIEYVHLVADYRLNKQIRLQCAAFKRGLAQLVDLDWLRMFDPRELQILISGAPTEIDVADWRRNTIYGNGYSDTSKPIETFWQVVGRFDEGQKRKLLKFATSCSLPPLLGFKDLVPQFAIAPAEEERLPTASTCMNLLKLPQCEDVSTMRQKLLYAVESNSGFELS